MRIELLGPLQIDGRTSTLGRRDQAVLSALAVRSGEVLPADRLAEAIWGEEPPPSWPKVVQGCVMRLRRMLGPSAIETDPAGYRLTLDGDRLDTHHFEQLIDRGRALLGGGEPDRAAVSFTRALELWRGSPFAVLDTWSPGRIESARLDELRRAAEETVLDARLQLGESRDVIAIAEARVGEEPLREHRWAILATALYRSGRQADALRAIKTARRTLLEQLGLEPGSELVDLEAAILQQDDSLTPAPAPPAVSEQCPYKGLVPYDVDDAESYFGRSSDIAACLDRFDAHPLLVVTGPSGSGKSSLVRAGLVPALKRAGRASVVLVPGADPDAAMTNALSSTDGAPIVVVDQFEEVFTLGDDSASAGAMFCRRLAEYASTTAPVILAVRADHVAALAIDAQLARLAEGGLHLVTPLAGEALSEAIEGPAALAGLRLEPGLVDLLARDCEGEPGALPLLSHALVETWQRRDGRVLTVDGYRASGEIRGAVARSADRLYESLPPDQRPKLRSVMLRLVSPSADGEPVRSRVATRTFGGDVERERVLGLLVRARLVTSEEDTVELAHEALARAWPRLRSWLDEDAGGQRILRHLAAAADGWESLGRPATELYRGARLESTLEWQETTSPDLTDFEQAFLDASQAAASSERAALAEQARRQARQNTRLRRSLVGVAVLLVAALVGGVLALQQRRTAQREERRAALTALTSNSSALRSNRRDLAALLAVEAHRMDPSASTEAALFSTFTGAPGLQRVLHTDVSLTLTDGTAVYLPDGNRVALGDGYGAVQLVDLATGQTEKLAPLSDRFGWPLVDIAADGRFLVAAWRPLYEPETGLVTVWDLESEQQRFAPVTVPFRIGDVELSSDGSTVVASGGRDGIALIFDGATGELHAEVPGLPRPDAEIAGPNGRNVVVTAALGFAGDGSIAIGSMAGPIRFVDPGTGEEQRRIDADPATACCDIAFSADGSTFLAQGSGMNRFDVASGTSLWGGNVETEQCDSIAVAEVIGAVLCGEWSGRVLAFDLETGTEVGRRFDSQLGEVCALDVSPDGSRLIEVAGCSFDNVTVVEWRLDGGGPVSDLVVEAAGDRWVTGFDGSVLVAEYSEHDEGDVQTRRIDLLDPAATSAYPNVWGLAPADKPHIALAVFDDGESPPTIGLYDVERHEAAGPSVDPGISIDGFWSDGRRAIVYGWEESEGSWVQHVRGIDLGTGELTGPTLDPEQGLFFDLAEFSSDAYYTVVIDQRSGRETNAIQRRDLTTGAVLAESAVGYNRVAIGGGIVIASTVNGRLAELDPVTLEPVGAPFPGTAGPVTTIDVDRSGQRVLVRAEDDSLRIFDIPTRIPLGDPVDTDEHRGNAVLRDNGMSAAAVTGFGIVVWDLDPDHWVEAACVLAGRNLTHAEWEQYIGDLAPYRRTCEQFPEGD